QSISWRDQVRFYQVIDQRWTSGTVAGNRVVGTRRRALRPCRSHRDDGGIVARSADGGEAVRSHRVVASPVARSNYHHNASLPGGFHCLAHRIERVALEHRTSQRHVNYTDVVGVFQRDRLLNGGDHLAVGARSVLIEYTQVDDVDVGSHTGKLCGISICRAGTDARATDQAGHVCSVSELVCGGSVARDKALAIDHTAGTAGVVQIGMIGNAAVDDRYSDAGAVLGNLRRRNVRLDRGGVVLVRGGHANRTIGRDVGDVG